MTILITGVLVSKALEQQKNYRLYIVNCGDSVAVDPGIFCGKCDQCKAGRFNLCRTLTGSPVSKDGCLAEHAIVPEDSCFASKELSLDELRLIEPLSITVYALNSNVAMCAFWRMQIAGERLKIPVDQEVPKWENVSGCLFRMNGSSSSSPDKI